MAEVWVAAVGAGVSLYSAHEQGEAAEDARDAQSRAQDQQTDVMRDQLEFGQQRYQDWRRMFWPVMQELRTLAFQDVTPDYAQISSDMGQRFGAAQDAARRQAFRYGLDPSDGSFGLGQHRLGVMRGVAEVNARNQAREAAEHERFNKLSSFYAGGTGLRQSADRQIGQGYTGLGNAFGNSAAMFGNRANRHAGNAAFGWQQAGAALGGVDWQNAWNNLSGLWGGGSGGTTFWAGGG